MDVLGEANSGIQILAVLGAFLVFFGGTMFSLGGFRKDLAVMQAELKSMTSILIKQQTIEVRMTAVEERARERYAELSSRIERAEKAANND